MTRGQDHVLKLKAFRSKCQRRKFIKFGYNRAWQTVGLGGWWIKVMVNDPECQGPTGPMGEHWACFHGDSPEGVLKATEKYAKDALQTREYDLWEAENRLHDVCCGSPTMEKALRELWNRAYKAGKASAWGQAYRTAQRAR